MFSVFACKISSKLLGWPFWPMWVSTGKHHNKPLTNKHNYYSIYFFTGGWFLHRNKIHNTNPASTVRSLLSFETSSSKFSKLYPPMLERMLPPELAPRSIVRPGTGRAEISRFNGKQGLKLWLRTGCQKLTIVKFFRVHCRDLARIFITGCPNWDFKNSRCPKSLIEKVLKIITLVINVH